MLRQYRRPVRSRPKSAVKVRGAPSDERVVSAEPDHRHYTRRVVLPSGKTIEVVYFEEQRASHTRLPRSLDGDIRELHICSSCDSELVYPVTWQEFGPTHWEVTLRCPNCEWNGTGVYDQELVEEFDEELDRGTEALVRDLKRLTRANMEDEVERFTRALAAGAILPEDF
jgi:hypothetical protein